MGVHVHHLAGEVQPRQELALHGGRVDFLHRHAAAGDDGFVQRTQPAQRNRQRLQRLTQLLPLLAGHLAALLAAVHAADGREFLRHPAGQQGGQYVQQLLAGLGFKLPLQPCVQLLHIKAGLQIQRDLRVRQIIRQMAAHGQGQRAGNAEMSEQHLAQLGIQGFLALFEGEGHVFQRQALQPFGPFRRRLNGGKHRRGRDHRMPRRHGEGIAVAAGAGHGIALAAGGEDDRVSLQRFAAHQRHAADCAVLLIDSLHPAVQADIHPCRGKRAAQGADHVAGLLRSGEHAPSALGYHRAALVLQQLHHPLRVQEAQCTVQKPRIPGHLPQKLIDSAVVGHVAAALAGDVDLFAQLLVALQQRDVRPRPCSVDGGHHAACAAADDDDLTHDAFHPPDKPRRWSRWPPADGNAGSELPCGAGPAPPAAR